MAASVGAVVAASGATHARQAVAVPGAPASEDEVRRLIDARAEALRLPSLAVVVLTDGQPFVEHYVGSDGTTPYHLGSTSKQFTGLAVQALVADGRLRLEDRLAELLPDLEVASAAASSVTVGDLLGHTSGWSQATGERKWGWFSGAPDSIREEAAAVAEAELVRPPGSAFEYTNAGYDVLGAVVEEVTGTTYATALQDLVAEPLGLTRTTGDPVQAERWGVAVDHYTWFGTLTRPTPAPHPGGGVPSALVVSSADDLSRLLQAHLGTVRTQLPAEVLSAAREPVRRVDDHVAYGSGWFVRPMWEDTPPGADWRTADLPTCLEHEGTIDRSMTTLFVCPEAGLGVVALTNVGAAPDDLRLQRLRVEVVHLLLGTEAPPRQGDVLVDRSRWLLVGLPMVHAALVGAWVLARRRGRRGWPVVLHAVVTLVFSGGVLWLALVHVPRRDGGVRTVRSMMTAMPDLGLVTVFSLVLAVAAAWLAVRTALDRREA